MKYPIIKKPVVLLAKNDYAGILWKLRCAINRYSKKYEAVHIAFDVNQFHYPIEILASDNQLDHVQDLLDNAACIILKDYDLQAYELPLITVDPSKCIWYGVGANYRYRQKESIFDKWAMRLVSTPDMLCRDDDIYLPAPYDTDEYTARKMKLTKEINVIHSPSNITQKGTPLINTVINKIMVEYPKVKYIEIAGQSHAYAMREKRNADIFIDQIGQHHILGYNSIEAAAYGSCVVTDTRDDTDNPAVHATPDTLYKVLEGLVKKPAEIIKNGRDMRKWVVGAHGYKAVMGQLEPLIDRIVRN